MSNDPKSLLLKRLKQREMEIKKSANEEIEERATEINNEVPEILEEDEIPRIEEEVETKEEKHKEVVEKVEEPEQTAVEEVEKVVNKEKETKVVKMEKVERPVKFVKAPVEREHVVEVDTNKNVVQLLRSVESPEEAELEDIKYMIAEAMPDAVADYVIDIAGKPVLTYAGILKAAVETGNIECTVEPVEISQRRVIFKAKAKHLERNVIVEGIGVVDLDIEEERIRRLKEKYKNDPYRLRNYDEQLARLKEYRIQIAFSRAQRNALKYLINEREWAHKFKLMLFRK